MFTKREEKQVGEEIEVVDAVAVLQLCEKCREKYDLSKINLGVYK